MLTRGGSWPAWRLGVPCSPVPLSTGCLRMLDALQEQVYCLSQALDMLCGKRLQVGKGHVFLLPCPMAFLESRSNACALNPLQAMIALNSDGETSFPHVEFLSGADGCQLPCRDTSLLQSSTPGGTMLLRHLFPHPLFL